MQLSTQSNFADPDAAYRLIVEAHRGIDDAQSAALDAALVLVLANHIGDLDVLVAATPGGPASLLDAFRNPPEGVRIPGQGEAKTSGGLEGGQPGGRRRVHPGGVGAAMQDYPGREGPNGPVPPLAGAPHQRLGLTLIPHAHPARPDRDQLEADAVIVHPVGGRPAAGDAGVRGNVAPAVPRGDQVPIQHSRAPCPARIVGAG